jgi:hypothetical protein
MFDSALNYISVIFGYMLIRRNSDAHKSVLECRRNIIEVIEVCVRGERHGGGHARAMRAQRAPPCTRHAIDAHGAIGCMLVMDICKSTGKRLGREPAR